MYNKIFTKILDSSIWMEPTPTRIVWLTFIAAMDETGFVQFASVANVAHRAVVPLLEAENAILTLEAPDPNSSDPENDGRRIERVPGGWIVLNAVKYRELVTRTVIQEQTRKRVERHRERQKETNTCNAPVTACNENVTPSEADSESEADTKASSETTRVSSAEEVDPLVLRLFALFRRKPWRKMDAKEKEAFRKAKVTSEDLEAVEAYFADDHPEWGVKNFRIRKLQTLLNNWNGEVDKAGDWKANPPCSPKGKLSRMETAEFTSREFK